MSLDGAPAAPAPRRSLGVAVAGFGWMGRVHTQAYARVLHHFPQLPVAPVLVAVADEVPGRAEEAVGQFGFAAATRDWRDIAADPNVAAVSVAAPNFLHREIGVAMAQAGKHIWIEKPVGLTTADATAVADAVKSAGLQSAVGFNYRNAPAVAAARELIAAGELGSITHARFRLFSDYAAHPDGALSWRFERERGGSGVLGDLASHGVDLARYLLGDIDSLVSDTATFLTARARPTGPTSGHVRAAGGELGPVENEDYVSSLLRFASGARGTLEASRVAVGEQNNYGFEIHGTKGAVFWDFRRMGELGVGTGTTYQDQPVSTLYVGPGHGEYAAFQPGSATSMGYDDLKVIEAFNFLRSIAEGTPHGSTLDDAVRSATALDAMAESAATGKWVSLR
ncbi:MAG TPA: Gfo/Idh/MocA family oxidoreductase [Nakamurella sp.]